MKSCRATLGLLLLMMTASTALRAAGDDDALDVANRAADKAPRVARDWQLSFEGGVARAWQRDSGAPSAPSRARLELRIDSAPTPRWRLLA